MYQAKQNGGNNYQRFTHKLNSILIKRIEIGRKLRNAIHGDELLLYYQPKVAFSDNTICGVEVLIRWMPEPGKMISPAQFIPIAEETGMIDEIGAWVLNAACKQANRFKEMLGRSIQVSVNISSNQFKNINLIKQIDNITSKNGTEPKSIELEITESALAENMSLFVKKLHQLKNIGAKLAIDDFGTGYSSLTYLKDFPVDRLKIDQGFVYNLESTPTIEAILRAIVSLGHNLGLRVIAEGVETEFQRDFLWKIGCDEMQGFLFSKPLPVCEVENLILGHTT